MILTFCHISCVISAKFPGDVRGSHRMNLNDFGDPMTFSLTPPAGYSNLTNTGEVPLAEYARRHANGQSVGPLWSRLKYLNNYYQESFAQISVVPGG